MPKAVAKKAPKKKVANGYKLPDPIPKGEIVTDLKKQKWIIGSSIGIGGFGEIYSAALYANKTPSNYPAVIKIEPHGNGPLFVEMHFYMRNANPNDINNWKKEKKLPFLGMPPFLGSGSHECNGEKYRFVVMERYGTDLWKLFVENGRRFPEHTVYKLAWQIINVLEYIHNRTYIHADIKGANLLLDLKSQNEVYLVDFGLASHYTTKNEYKFDPKKAHNGTIEYTSRDAHMGIATMRSDFEILLYNLIQWLCDNLPWMKNLKDPAAVQQQKEKAFSNVSKFLKECFGASEVPEPISQFMNLLASVKFNETPNYDKFRDVLVKGLKKLNHQPTGKLEFLQNSAKSSSKAKAPLEDDEVSPKKTKVSSTKSKATPVKPKATPVKLKSTPVKSRATPSKSKATPAKAISTLNVSSQAKRSLSEANDSHNDSIDSIVLDERCMSGKDMRKQLLASIDGDAEYVVQIKKRKTKATSNVESPVSSPITRGRRKVKQIDSSITDSEPEIIFSCKGTRSRPGPSSKMISNKKLSAGKRSLDKPEYDSEKDMFEDSVE